MMGEDGEVGNINLAVIALILDILWYQIFLNYYASFFFRIRIEPRANKDRVAGSGIKTKLSIYCQDTSLTPQYVFSMIY
jgi:hypothetical protein